MKSFAMPSRPARASAPVQRLTRRARGGAAALLALSTLAACASAGGPSGRMEPHSARGSRDGIPDHQTFPRGNPALDQGWTISSREQVDAWLHGFAMIMSDTTHVPIFARGYRANMEALKHQRNISTQLDANAARLGSRFAVEPTLVNGQFVALYFASFDDLMSGAREFLNAEGDPREATGTLAQTRVALFAQYFPTASDREWLQLFIPSLQDEYTRFYHDYWTSEQAHVAPVLSEVTSRWNASWYPELRTYLSNTQQGSGEMLLSLPLAGEGRTAAQSGITASAIGVPTSVTAADEAFYGFVHEAVQQVTNAAIGESVSAIQRQQGAYDLYGANAAVRGGALLIQRVAPSSLAGYMRYYMGLAGVAVPSGDATLPFEKTFPLPRNIVDDISRQLQAVLGGA